MLLLYSILLYLTQVFYICTVENSFNSLSDFGEDRNFSEKKFKAIAETATDSILIADQSSIIAYCNKKTAEIFQYSSPNDLLGKNLSILMPEKYREGHQKGVKRFIESGIAKVIGQTIQIEGLRKSGEIFPIELSLSFWEEDDRYFFTGIIRDISHRIEKELELKNAYEELQATTEELQASNEELMATEEQLHNLTIALQEKVEEKTRQLFKSAQALIQSEDKYKKLVSSVKDYAIFMLTPDGYVASWNPGAKNLKGYSEEEIIGKHFSIFYPEDIKNEYPQYELKKAVEVGRFEDEGWRIRKDGRRFWANVVITTMYDDQGKHIGFSKVTRDLTERKAAEDNLKKINNDLDNFIYTASHDLKAPISNLEGLMNAVFDQIESECSTGVKELFLYMNKSVEKLKVIIRELTEISQVQKNTADDIGNVSIEELIEEFKISYNKEFEENKTSIFTELKTQELFFSRKNLRSIINNILGNAIKYRSPERDPRIIIKTYKVENFNILEFQDNGLGFNLNDKEKLFGMFKRLHDHVEGTGVGLYIVKKIIDNSGGKIEVHSEIGKGSTFKVYLPATT